ncbi:MAG: FtsX-like permease family protein, partial [Ignavibacteriales bacterium]
KRYTLSKKDSRFINLISAISVAGISLGVATLIIAISILNGFEKTITEKIVDFDAHLKISSYKNILPDYKVNKLLIEDIIGEYKTYVNPFAVNLAIIGTKKIKEGVNIKGIDPEDKWSGVKNNITAGSFALGEKKIIVGKKLADKLRVKVNDKVTLFALKNNKLPTPENFPNVDRFIITAIFESGMAEYDDLIAYISLNDAQQLFSIGDNINGYDIKVNNISKIDSLAEVLSAELRYPYYVKSVFQIHRNIFTWINLQKEPIPIVLGLIIIVAVINIIGTLLMIVLEKTSSIGILRSLGATKKLIVSIFIYQGVFLAVSGIFIGNILALILTTLQKEYNIISLPSSVYFVSTVPIEISPEVFFVISTVTFFLALFISIIPSYIASKVQPVSSIRFR